MSHQAYGFGGGVYHFPVSGCTHREGVQGKNHAPMAISAYRFHEEDPVVFSGGVRMHWRIGDVQNPKTHPESPKCYIENLTKSRGDMPAAGGAANTTVSTLAWVYSWPSTEAKTDDEGLGYQRAIATPWAPRPSLSLDGIW